MTETESAAGPGPDGEEAQPAAPEALSPEPPPRPRRPVLGWLSLLGFLVLAAAIALSWLYPRKPPVADAAAVAALNLRIDGLAHRLAESETNWAALSGAETKLAAAEKSLAARPGPPDLGPVEARLAALEHRPVAAANPPGTAELATSLAPLKERIARLETSLAALTPLSARIDSLQKSVAELGSRIDGVERTARLAAAQVALEQGRPLGQLPGAPRSLARYATSAPPTLATLRLQFPEAAIAERAAARPDEAGRSLAQRMMDRLGELFTLREGNKVLVGNPADPALATAQAALDAGDLEAAVAALQALPPPLAPPMQQWKDQAEALLAAEAALAHIAGAD